MTKPDIVLIHRGGLGDFLTAWPAMLSICDHFSGNDCYWIGDSNRLPWLGSLGVRHCPGGMRRAFDLIFGARHWPEEFANAKLYWFGLNRRSPVGDHPGLVFLQGLRGGAFVPVRQVYIEALRSQGVPFNAHWLEIWRAHFGVVSQKKLRKPRSAYFFPGAGHPAKQWPLEQFFELACWLANLGVRVRFVLGPAEAERGMSMAGFPVDCPPTLVELQQLLHGADVVVGNDSGPMHLAGMLGVPGLALFGPASETQWAPVGLRVLGAGMPCRPCTVDGRIGCTNARCMTALGQDVVRRELAALLQV